MLINGSENNAATSQYSLAPAFGNRRPGQKGLYNGSIGAIVDNSALDARPYSLTGQQTPKDFYNRITIGDHAGRPAAHSPPDAHRAQLLRRLPMDAQRRCRANQTGLVPDAAERAGDLSGLLNAQGQPLAIYNPATGLPFTWTTNSFRSARRPRRC